MEVLTEASALNVKNCALKRFAPDEVHVTRIYGCSVLILMTEGILRFCEDGVLIELEKGEYYIQPANRFQSGYLGKEPLLPFFGKAPNYYYFEFEGGVYGDSEKDNGIPLRGTWDGVMMTSVLHACELANDRLANVNRFMCNAYLYKILGLLYTNRSEISMKMQFVSKVRDYVDSNYSSVTLVDDMARHFGYTLDYIYKLFQREYGVSLHRYLQTVRMEQALCIIRNTDTPIIQIPSIVGYANYTSFYRTFLKYYGVSPQAMLKETLPKRKNDSRKDNI